MLLQLDQSIRCNGEQHRPPKVIDTEKLGISDEEASVLINRGVAHHYDGQQSQTDDQFDGHRDQSANVSDSALVEQDRIERVELPGTEGETVDVHVATDPSQPVELNDASDVAKLGDETTAAGVYNQDGTDEFGNPVDPTEIGDSDIESWNRNQLLAEAKRLNIKERTTMSNDALIGAIRGTENRQE